MELSLPLVDDFAVDGAGRAPVWNAADWQPLTHVGAGTLTYETRMKVAYSLKGLYFLVECEDRRLTCAGKGDFDDLYTEDVVEVFLWPEESQVLYFEYEISPLGAELPILVPNCNGRFHGWLPWHYEGDRRVRRATSVRGGAKAPMADVKGWTAEFFIPFAILVGLRNCPPTPGTRWRANCYRIDYDAAHPPAQWAWDPATGSHFHDFRNFGAFRFL